ncbi:nucleoside hydrolase [Neobittarella massiliensis]|uniref:nucleoside hydrolase n=1 Tax=Neobittarella massiliensis (ex Bilen et al. 2018) TaxID=2041842 RepID=UPI000CF68E1A|nr:nucleoside hydrolase [Neobittarella massiliensis]
MRKIPLIIDTDPGHDDAFAIMLALSSDKLDVKAITTVCGNSTVENTTQNALNILTLLGRTDIPVAKGIGKPMLQPLDRSGGIKVHGESGLDGPVFGPPACQPVEMHAVDLMAKIVRESEEKVTLAPLGPLCNIAAFILCYPELIQKIERISIMGGSVFSGNVTPSAEYNIFVDPESAQVVFSSGIPVIMHSIGSTGSARVSDDDIQVWRELGTNAGNFAGELMDFYKLSSKDRGFSSYNICDAHAVAYLIDPSIYETFHTYVEVDLVGQFTRGQTVADMRTNEGSISRYYQTQHKEFVKNCYVVTKVDRQAYVDLLTDALKKLG